MEIEFGLTKYRKARWLTYYILFDVGTFIFVRFKARVDRKYR